MLCDDFGLDPSDVALFDHGKYFSARSLVTKSEARRELGLDPDRHIFLAIGFLQAHKGFDRAVAAFARPA